MSYVYTKQHQQQDLFGGDIEVILGENYESNELIQLAEKIDRDLYIDAFSEAYSSYGRASLPVRQMFGLELLKHIWKGVSDEHIVEQFRTNVAVMGFCGYKNVYSAKMNAPKSSSSMTHFRNRINAVDGLAEKVQNIHLKSMMTHVPKKRRGQFDMDSTIIEESVAFPNDVDALASICEKGGELLDKARELGGKLLEGVVAQGRRVAKKLKYAYHFGGKKKEILQETKEKIANIGEKFLKTIEEVKEKLKESGQGGYKNLIKKIEKTIEVGGKIIEQQREMMKTGTNKIANRIVSLSKEYVRPIVKGKAGKLVQFGSKLQMGMIGRTLACVVSLGRDNEHDSKSIRKGVEFYEEITGKPPKEFGTDKGYREKSGESYERMKGKGIVNGAQGTSDFNSLDEKTRKRLYKRRAFSESIIGDVKGHRGCNNNKHKKENVKWKLIVGCMTSNYLRVY